MNVATDSTGFHLENETRVEVMIIYADPLTRSRVMQIYQRLHQQLWQEFDFDASWWKLDYLAHPQIATSALESLQTADLVFFAVKAGTDLPPAVQEWLTRWPIRPAQRGKSLLALLEFAEGAIPSSSPARLMLRMVAARTHMDYLPYYASDTGEVGAQHPAQLERPEDVGLPVPRFGPRSTPNPLPRWGLNE